MCNTVYCGLINININTDVQIGCTRYVHIAAVWMMENNGYVRKWIPQKYHVWGVLNIKHLTFKHKYPPNL